MNTALTTTTQAIRTRPPTTWAGLRAASVGTHLVAEALAAADPPAASPDVAALCARAVEALATARPEDEVAPFPGIGQLGHQDRGQAAGADSDLAELITDTLDLAVAVLDNHDEPLSCAEGVAISRTVTVLCSARAALAGVIR